MDKNTPLSSLPSPEHEMEPKGKDIAKNKAQQPVDMNEPSAQVIKNILNYSKVLTIKPSKSVLKVVEYIPN